MENYGRKGSGDIGKQIRDAVTDALDSMDFGQLNQAISDTVNSALNEAKEQAASCREKIGNLGWLPKSMNRESREGSVAAVRPKPLEIQVNWKGRISGILFSVFGGIGSGIFGFLTTVFAVSVLLAANNPFNWCLAIISGMILAGFLTMLGAGVRQNKRIGRLRQYVHELKRRGKPYCELEELGKGTAKSLPFIRKDMKKILELGMLPEARMDDQKTCLMLDEETYRQYRMAQASLEERQRQEQDRRSGHVRRQDKHQEDKKTEQAEDNRQENWNGENRDRETDSQVMEAISRGGQYMEQLDGLREAMAGQAVAEKLIRLDTVLERLFAVLRKHPEQLDELERFMEYYLPTTVKLVRAYHEFAQVEFPGENIRTAKKEIEETMDTINRAFENLLDDIYQDAAFDVMTDASVLQSMLAREGLTGSDFT